MAPVNGVLYRMHGELRAPSCRTPKVVVKRAHSIQLRPCSGHPIRTAADQRDEWQAQLRGSTAVDHPRWLPVQDSVAALFRTARAVQRRTQTRTRHLRADGRPSTRERPVV